MPLVAGERSPAALAALGDPRLKATRRELEEALTGKFRDIHAFEIKTPGGQVQLNYRGFPAVICTSPNETHRPVPGHPRGLRPRGGRHHLHRLRGHRRGVPRGRRLHHGGGGGEPPRPAPPRGHRAQPLVRHRPGRPPSPRGGPGPSSRWPRRPGSRWSGSTWATPSAPPCTRSPRSRLLARDRGPVLKPGMVFAVEPMVNAGSPRGSPNGPLGGRPSRAGKAHIPSHTSNTRKQSSSDLSWRRPLRAPLVFASCLQFGGKSERGIPEFFRRR